MNRIEVALFNCRADAEPLQKRLADAGFQTELHDELHLERFWFVSRPSSGVRLEVPADQFERAYQLMLDWDAADGALHRAIRCPECKSLRVDYPQFARRAVIPNIVMGVLATIGAVPREYYCQDCHYTWPKEGTKMSRARSHSAPYYFIEGIAQAPGQVAASKHQPA